MTSPTTCGAAGNHCLAGDGGLAVPESSQVNVEVSLTVSFETSSSGSAPTPETPPTVTFQRCEFSETTQVPLAYIVFGCQGLGDDPHCAGGGGGVLSVHSRPVVS